MDTETLLASISRQNSWWRKNSVPPALDFPVMRTAGFAALRHLTGDSPRALLLMGPRQVGKTTILLQIVRQLLKSTTAQAICYLRLDDPDLAGQPLGRLVDLYRKSCRSPNRLAYLLLDEVHGSPGWAQQMKSWVDGNEPNRVLATGSLAPHLTDGSRESGPGRWDEVVVPPLGLFEYALLQGLAKEEEARLLPDGWWERPQVPVPQLERDLWPGYLLKGGFPASALENDVTTAHQRLREDIYERALVRDMAVYFGLRSFDTLRHLFRYVAEQSSCIANTKVLSARSGASAATIADMLVRLRETFLVAQTLPFVRGKAALRPRPKLYLCDASLRSAVLLHGPEIFQDASALGYIYETAAHSHLAHLARSRGGELSYWRDERGEVDFLLALPGRSLLPIEVTAGRDLRKRLSNLERCMARVGAPRGLLLGGGPTVHDEMGTNGSISFWNLPEFLWILGACERAQAHGRQRE